MRESKVDYSSEKSQTFSAVGWRSGWAREGLMWALVLPLTWSGADWITALCNKNFFSSLLPHSTRYSPVIISTAPMILYIQPHA